MQLVGLNFFAGDMPGGDRGLVSWPARPRSSATTSTSPSASESGWAARPSTPSTATGSTARLRGEQDELGAENLALAATGGRADRRHRAGRAGQRRAGVPAATAADALAVIDRVSATPTEPRAARRPLPPGGQRRRRRQGDRGPHRPRSRTCRSPTPPAATSPAPARFRCDRQLADLAGRGVRRLGRPRVQAVRRHRRQLRLAAARRR